MRTRNKNDKTVWGAGNAGDQIVMVLGFVLIRWESGASFLNQSHNMYSETKAILDYF